MRHSDMEDWREGVMEQWKAAQTAAPKAVACLHPQFASVCLAPGRCSPESFRHSDFVILSYSSFVLRHSSMIGADEVMKQRQRRSSLHCFAGQRVAGIPARMPGHGASNAFGAGGETGYKPGWHTDPHTGRIRLLANLEVYVWALSRTTSR